jgi:hypothetical protein
MSLFGADAEVESRAEVTESLTPAERDKCRAFWLKYKMIERVHWGALIPLAIVLISRSPNPTLAQVSQAGIFVFLFTAVWMRNLDCPVCNAKVSGGLITLLPRVRHWRIWPCFGCGLKRGELKKISEQPF